MDMYPCMAISLYPTSGSSMNPAYSDSGLEDLMGFVESWEVSWQVTWIDGKFLNWIQSDPVMNHSVLQYNRSWYGLMHRLCSLDHLMNHVSHKSS